MPYRSLGRTVGTNAAVGCRKCAAPKTIALPERQHDTFTCERCEHEQPVLRDVTDLEIETTSGVGSTGGKYDQLLPFARTLGVLETSIGLTLKADGVPCEVSLDINSGNVRGVDLVCRGNGFPVIRFECESETHRSAKETGLAREVQTGDEIFDARVFIESSATDADLLLFLSSPAVRAAIVRLLEHANEVKVEGSSVVVSVSKDREAFDPVRIRQWLGCLTVIATAPRPLEITYEMQPASVTLLKIGGGLLLPAGVLSIIFASMRFPVVGPSGIVVSGIAGLVLGVVLQPLFTRILRGRSSSLRDIMTVRIISLSGFVIFGIGLLITLNGALDRSPERLSHMKITSTAVDSDDSSKINVHAVDERNIVYTYSFHAPVDEKLEVLVGFKPGRFGWEWTSRDAVLVPPSAP